MCWFLRVYGTVLHNLFLRFYTNLADSLYNCHSCRRLCCCCCCCCCCRRQRPDEESVYSVSRGNISEILIAAADEEEAPRRLSLIEHDYVMIDDIDANYLEVCRRKIETESYYRTIDRPQAEELLTGGREDGSCIVRPYKEQDASIKYIVSIYARQHFFHLFIRQIDGGDRYGIGRAKANELVFGTPCDIIEFYSRNTLKCTNQAISLHIKLRPINP